MLVRQVFEYYHRQDPPRGRIQALPLCGTRSSAMESGRQVASPLLKLWLRSASQPAPAVGVLVVGTGEPWLLGKRAPRGEANGRYRVATSNARHIRAFNLYLLEPRVIEFRLLLRLT